MNCGCLCNCSVCNNQEVTHVHWRIGVCLLRLQQCSIIEISSRFFRAKWIFLFVREELIPVHSPFRWYSRKQQGTHVSSFYCLGFRRRAFKWNICSFFLSTNQELSLSLVSDLRRYSMLYWRYDCNAGLCMTQEPWLIESTIESSWTRA